MDSDADFTQDELRQLVARFNHEPTDELNRIASKKVLVACSGGADSIALALILRAHEVDYALAYIEHGLSNETAECEVLVKDLAHNCDVPFFTAHLDLGDFNVEATARAQRYDALETLRSTHGYDVIVTAHHMDDVAETFFINLLRGSGSGISSLASQRNNIVRPILNWRKSELEELVSSVKIEYFSDPMNESSRFVRNRIRSEVIPLLADIAQRDVTPLIVRAADHMSSDNQYLTKIASRAWPGDTASTRSLTELDAVLQVHALREWVQGYPPSNEEIERILDVVHHRITSTQISGHRTIWRSGGILYQDVTPPHK